MNREKYVFFLDVDGVITDEFARVDTLLLSDLERLQKDGHRFIFVTGRSLNWMENNVFPHLNSPNGFTYVCEYGKVISHAGEISVEGRIPQNVEDRVKKNVGSLFGVFFDQTKKTLVTIEADHAVAKMHPDKVEASLQKAERMLDAVAEGLNMDVIRSTFAVDMVKKGTNKEEAGRKALAYVIPSRKIIVVGDSPRDLDMTKPLRASGIPHEFYFVGKKLGFEPTQPNQFKTEAGYSEGLREVLTAKGLYEDKARRKNKLA
ncbi:MAG: HAD-IIB family hydrolase [Candidatus Micrarchaeota archaeon]|nr:HAD-IIB family hydrolase [Candidatus Micrarchaeota archaeon]